MSWLDALLGKLRADGVDLELRGGLNFQGFDVSGYTDDDGNPAGWTVTTPPGVDTLPNSTEVVDVSTSAHVFTGGAANVGLYVGTGGHVAAKLQQDSEYRVFSNVPSGTTLEGDFKAIGAAADGTTAAAMLGLARA